MLPDWYQSGNRVYHAAEHPPPEWFSVYFSNPAQAAAGKRHFLLLYEEEGNFSISAQKSLPAFVYSANNRAVTGIRFVGCYKLFFKACNLRFGMLLFDTNTFVRTVRKFTFFSPNAYAESGGICHVQSL